MGKLRDAVAYRQTVQDVTALLRKARQQATLQGVPVAFAFNTANQQYGIAGQSPAKVPEGLKVQLVTAAGAVLADGSQTIVFLPEGGATGGSISLIRGEGSGVRLRVDWLSGLVTKEAL
jgi:general secretion pathway protein H